MTFELRRLKHGFEKNDEVSDLDFKEASWHLDISLGFCHSTPLIYTTDNSTTLLRNKLHKVS